RGRAQPVVPAGRRDHRRDHLQLPRHRQADGRGRDAARHPAGAGLRDAVLRRLPDPRDRCRPVRHRRQPAFAAPLKEPSMSTLIHSGSFERSAMRRWRARLAHFGVTGWLGLAVVAFWAAAAAFGPALLSQSGALGGGEVFAPMSAAHWLGNDYLGRDMLARVIEGARYTVGVAFVATLLASGTGTLLALLAAASGRWIDATLSRALDTLTAIPSKMFALLMVAGFGTSVPMLIVTAAIIYVPGS